MIRWLCDKPRALCMDSVRKHLEESMRDNYMANGGPCARKLERTLHDILHVDSGKAVVAAASGTAALHALAGALCLEHGPLTFATQSFTFPTTRTQILASSMVVDIDDGGGPDLAQAPETIDVLFVTNCFGNVVDIALYQAWAEKTGTILLFDNASTPATIYRNSNAVNFGTGCAVSLHHTKPLGFGEGGAVIVDERYENAVRRCLNFGYDTRKNDLIFSPYGSNYKLPDTSAAFLLTYLEHHAQIRERHQALFSLFARKLVNIPAVRLFPSVVAVPFASCLAIIFDRPVPVTPFLDKGIQAHKYYKPLEPTLKATRLYERIICLPLHIDLGEKEIDAYLEVINAITNGF